MDIFIRELLNNLIYPILIILISDKIKSHSKVGDQKKSGKDRK